MTGAHSWWGCIASLAMFQCFGVVLFQAFLCFLKSVGNPLVLLGAIFGFVFMVFEAKTVHELRETLAQGPAGADSAPWKRFMALATLGLLAWLILAYPLPTTTTARWPTILFLAISSFFSNAASRGAITGSSIMSPDTKGCLFVIFVGGVFTSLGLTALIFQPKNPLEGYIVLLLGGFAMLMGTTQLLVQPDAPTGDQS